MVTRIFSATTMFLFGIGLLCPPALAGVDGHPPAGVAKTTGTPSKAYMNINNISTVIANKGFADIDVQEQNSGFVFPKGSGKAALFQSGFLWGGIVSGQVRVGGSAYRTGLTPGKILPNGQAEDPNLPNVRIYRVRPDYKTATLAAEVADEGLSPDAIRAQYELDWNEWPAADGAPFTDLNGNGTYEPGTDIPGVKGADQTIWYVANDLDPSKTTFLYGSNPIGIELRVTMWAYSSSGALGNMMFRAYKIINRSGLTIDSMYVSQWSDPDLGNSTDDFAGCDVPLSLAYIYNANATDDTYRPLPPPSAGFDFFQGPVVDSPGDSAIFNGTRIYGKRNLPMTAFYYFARGDANVTDPTQGSYEGTTQFYNFFRGRIGKTGEFFVDPTTNEPTTFALSGDPQTRTGWIDGQLLPAGDRRLGMASGPFSMAPLDTQEVVVAAIAAGAIPGTDRLSAIGLLKFYDQQAQLAYDNFFDLPVAPPAPKVTVTELDGEIVLNWGEDKENVRATETSNSKGYLFQGYNVYQLPSASAGITEARRIATYDVSDGIGKIEDFFFDASTGTVAKKVVQFGNDTGIRRYISIRNDDLNGGSPLINGIRYYFAVTAYSYNLSDPVPNNLENPLAILTVVSHPSSPGLRYPAAFGDTIKTVVHNGPSDGLVIPVVVDPASLTGQQYSVTFTDDGAGGTTWNVIRGTTTVLSGQTNQTGDDTSPMVDGIQFRVIGAPLSFKTFTVPANASGAITPPEAGAFGFNASGFPLGPPLPEGTDRPDGTLQQSAGLVASSGWGIHTGMNDPEMDIGYDFFVSRVTQSGARWPLIIPNDFEIRFTAAGGKALVPAAFGSPRDALIDIPFELWNIGVNTPDDPSDDYRLFANILDVDNSFTWTLLSTAGTDSVDNGGGGANHAISGGDNDPFTDWFYWVLPEDKSPGQTGYDAIVTQVTSDIAAGTDPYLGPGTDGDVIRRMVLVGWNFGSVADASAYLQQVPEVGTVFRIVSTKPNGTNDSFVVTVPAVTNNADLAKEDVRAINVFPNPYYGVNSEELNKYQRFVTFSHLPQRATIRIFNMAGIMVRVIEKDNSSTFERWNLSNESGLPVGSGLYIAHIDMPDLGATKVLKLAIIQEAQILDRF